MIFKDIAEYEETDSQLSKDTILRLHKEIERLNNIIAKNKYSADELEEEIVKEAKRKYKLQENKVKKLQEISSNKQKD